MRRSAHADLLVSFGSLVSTSVVTSVLGFVYWWLAARSLPVETVGAGSAAISAMMVISTVGMVGMGTLLIAELPRAEPRQRWALVSTGVSVAAVASGLLSACCVVLALTLLPHLRESVGTPLTAPLFLAGCSLAAACLVLDDALIGLRAGPLQLLRNAWFAGAKLVLLSVAIVAGGAGLLWRAAAGCEAILASWLLGTVFSLLVLSRRLRGLRDRGPVRPGLGLLRGLRRDAVDHNLLNLALFLPRNVLPLVVTLVLSTTATATFYTAWMLLMVLAMVPGHLATTLFAVASGDRRVLRAKLRVSLVIALGLGTPVALFLALSARLVMGAFGAQYVAEGGAVLAILALTYPATAIRQLYIAVARVRRSVRGATVYACGCGVAEVLAAWHGGTSGRLVDLALWVALAFCVEGALVAPVVLRAALEQPDRVRAQPVHAGRHRLAIEGGGVKAHADVEGAGEL